MKNIKQVNWKKIILPNLPYIFIALLATKAGQAWRLSAGSDISERLRNLMYGFEAAFSSPLPSLYPLDLCIGIVSAALIKFAVYVKGKNAKKFRKDKEYGSARWSA